MRYGDIESTFTKRLGVGCDNLNRIGRFMVLHKVSVHISGHRYRHTFMENQLMLGWLAGTMMILYDFP